MSEKRRKPVSPPSTTVDDGRLANGQFGANNRFAKGGAPLAARGLKFREVMFGEVSTADWRAMIRKQIEKAKRGDTRAFREIANRIAGKPLPASTAERLQLVTLAETILADRVDAIRLLRLANARGEVLDVVPHDDERLRRIEIVALDPPAERRRILRELGHDVPSGGDR